MKKITLGVWLVLALLINSVFAQKNCECPDFNSEGKAAFSESIGNVNYDEAKAIINLHKNSNSSCCQAIGYSMEAILLNAEGKTVESYTSAKKALGLLKSGYSTFASIESNRLVAMYYNRMGQPDSAIIFYYKSLEIAEKNKEYYTMAKLYANISAVFLYQDQIDKGLEFNKKSLNAAFLSKDTSAIAQCYANMITMYGRMYDETENMIYIDSAEQLVPIAVVYAKASQQTINLIRNYLSQTKISVVKNNFLLAIQYSDSLLSLVDERTNPVILNSIYVDRGAIYLGLNQYDEAIENLNKASEYAKQTQNLFMEKDIYSKLYDAYKASGATHLALENLEKYKQISDTLISKENKEIINEMEGKYNQAKSENKIKDLEKKKQFYLFLAIAGLLAALAIAFFLRQQSLKHKKDILETEQRLNRARMNPHFFFNALTTLQKIALRENDGQTMASNLSKFSNIMRETLESTYKEYVTIEQEMEFLNEYLEVQKIRFPQAFSYEITADKNLEIDELQIPAMIIQPFVENSIEHGFAGVNYPGNVTVKFASENNELLIEIQDNGKGLNTTIKENASTGHTGNEHISRASQIIKDRIYLLNIKLKTKAGFRIDNTESGGVIVKIHLPLLYIENKKA